MKGYWIVRGDISDPEAYKAYVAANAEAFRKFGAHFLVRSGKYETMEGGSRARNVVNEFKDYDTALAAIARPNMPSQRHSEPGPRPPISSSSKAMMGRIRSDSLAF